MFAEIRHKRSGTLRAEAARLLADYDGEFRCYVSNSLGTAVSAPARLIVEGGFAHTRKLIERKSPHPQRGLPSEQLQRDEYW